MNNLTAVDESSYVDEVVESQKPVLIKFWAPWCAPCKILDPVVESIAEEQGEALKVVTLNVDEAPGLAAQHGVRSLPTVTLLKGGEKLEALSGVQSKASLDALLTRHIQG
ncbi:thioredoxin [Vreelandella subglaciescola]|uniref:Thioredoxin n=2 Tax=Vreelandella subglaciescola TaxID=29571 RepID=A0A1M7GU71_9GAMM|nr:thioredoxin [Halomonas subglaciescola]SHM19407.1 thioredoxin [Halomonas subglaciescola]